MEVRTIADTRRNTELHITADQIRAKLGFSTIAIPRHMGAAEIAMIREAGITRMELCGLHLPMHYDYHDRAQVDEIMTECRKQGISIVAVHGPDLPYHCVYDAVRKAVVEEAVASARIAEEMGASVFVGHFSTDELSEKTACEMLEELDDLSIKVVAENGGDLREFKALADRIDSPRFGLVVDIGHTVDEDGINPFLKKERAREALRVCGDRLLHLHLHDFVDTDHYPPFDGGIQWDEIFLALQDLGYEGEYMFEAVARVSEEDTLTKTAAFPEEFARRYLDK